MAAWLKRELAISRDEARYVDVALQLRRLTVEPAPGVRLTPGLPLWTADAVAWRIPPSIDDKLAVATTDAGKQSAYDDGERLYLDEAGQVLAGFLRAEVIVSAGGVWDNLAKGWRLDACGERVVAKAPLRAQVRESQVAFVRWFAMALDRMRKGEEQEQQGALAFGKTRSGKTVVCLLCLLALAIDLPRVRGRRTVIALVSVNHPARAELDREIRDLLTPSWFTYREAPSPMSPAHTYTLVNGAQLRHMTAEDPDELRSAGMLTGALLNEAGRMAELAYRNVLNKLTDQDGPCLCAANRPQRTKANWLMTLAKGIVDDKKVGKPVDFEFFELDPLHNDTLAAGAKSRTKRILDRITPDADELESALMEVGDFVYASAFDGIANVSPIPETLPDITRLVTRKILGTERDFIVGADFQARPGCVASVWKVLGALPDRWILWCLRVVWAEDGGETALIDALEDVGIEGENCIAIADASGENQDYQHRRGLNSFRYFKDRGFLIRGPQPKKNNPYGSNPRPKELQVVRLCQLLREQRPGGLRTMMIADGVEAKPLAVDLQKCRAIKGKYGPIPGGQHAHAPDTAIYVAWAVLLVLRPGEVAARRKGEGGITTPVARLPVPPRRIM
jgi:hypothetical protein